MAINQKELILREYEEKQCIAFVYVLYSEKQEEIARFMYRKQSPQKWKIIAFIPDCLTTDFLSMVQFIFELPKEKMPLETIAAIGVSLFQIQLKEQIQTYTNLDFDIGQVIKDM
jgi:hypothetical protein